MSDVAPTATPTNGASKTATQGTPPPHQDVAVGPQTGSGSATRGPDGKFQSTSGAPANGASNATEPPKKFRLKDREYENEDEAWREVERGRHSARLLTEAEKRNRVSEAREKAIDEAKAKARGGDLTSFFRELGLSAEQERDFLARHLHDHHIVPESMDPTQRELASLRAKIADRDAQDKAVEEKRAADEKKNTLSGIAKKLDLEIVEAVKAGKIPNTRAAIQRIIQKTISFDERGMQLPFEQVAALVREDIAKDIGEFSSSTQIDERRELWGPAVFKAEADKWLAWFQSKLKSAPPLPQQQPRQQSRPADKSETFTPQEWLARMSRK